MNAAYSVFTIFFSPSDYPGKFVVRRFDVSGGHEPVPTTDVWTCGRLEEARALIPDDRIRFPRDVTDPQCVVETWI